ncbi:hypothetical protein SteCoe_12509 [Stentor coeruleus]|uniref:Major facilitator superfamily (MFS) profile domain-containing protein n=1 Tax=Stentor coeruleus TaxID=5963 RepID=A0A1R2CAP3_9CILI|nr:hypothetical protein SteCoe_12509 [Stentor coeruleus]
MEKNRAYTILEHIGWGKYNLFAFLHCGFAWGTFSFWFVSTAYVIQGATEEWDFNTFQAGIIGSFIPFGILFGSLSWGYIGDRYGRMYAFKPSAVIVSIGSLLLVFSPNFYLVAIALSLLGFGMAGELTLGGTVFCEFCPPSKRYYMTLLSLFISIGAIAVTLVALLVSLINTSKFYNWRIIVAIGVAIEICVMFFRFFMNETPAFLVSQNRQIEADRILNAISLKNTGKKIDKSDYSSSLNSDEIIIEKVDKKLIKSEESKPNKLFTPPLLKTTVVMGLVYMFAGYSYAGILYFMPEFLEEFSTSTGFAIILAQQCCGIPGVLLSAKLIETRLGRRFTILIFYSLSGLMILFLSFNTNFWFVLIISGAGYFFILIGLSAMFTIGPESFPTSIRSKALALMNVTTRIGGISSPIIIGYFLELSNGKFMGLLCLCVIYITAGVFALLLKETKGQQIG